LPRLESIDELANHFGGSSGKGWTLSSSTKRSVTMNLKFASSLASSLAQEGFATVQNVQAKTA
jgi:hypothetical protein